MTGMLTEIEKTAAYARDDAITHEDIDAVVTPVLDAVAYKMTDAIAARRFDDAMSIMSDLLDMNEPPHKILYSISKKLRQLLAARVCFEEGHGERKLMEICDIRFDFQARSVMSAAKKLSMDWCVNAVRLASETALRMNSARGANYAEQLTDLILKLAVPEGTK